MKLKDYLSQFEGLDPEMEVYQQSYGNAFSELKNAENLNLIKISSNRIYFKSFT
jgi:hypothetical protein